MREFFGTMFSTDSGRERIIVDFVINVRNRCNDVLVEVFSNLLQSCDLRIQDVLVGSIGSFVSIASIGGGSDTFFEEGN